MIVQKNEMGTASVSPLFQMLISMEDFNLEDLTITIRLISGGNTHLRIGIFHWVILPSLSTGYGAGSSQPIVILQFGEDSFKEYIHNRKYKCFHYFKWLCFEIKFFTYRLTDVGKLYPKNYNWRNDSVDNRISRFEALCKTDFYTKLI